MSRILVDALDSDENGEKLYVVYSTVVDDLLCYPATITFIINNIQYFEDESIVICNNTRTSNKLYPFDYISNSMNITRIIDDLGYEIYEKEYESKNILPKITDEMFIEMCNSKKYFI